MACGERRLTELELPWLSGYENSAPLRTGNAAYNQFQLDIFGEVADTLFQCRRQAQLPKKGEDVAQPMIEFLETAWERPDDGIWECAVRAGISSLKMMAWVAVDRAISSVEQGWIGEISRDGRRFGPPSTNRYAGKVSTPASILLSSITARTPRRSLLMMPLVGFLRRMIARNRHC